MAVVVLVAVVATSCSTGGEGGRPAATTERAASDVRHALAIEVSPLLGRPSAVAVHRGVVWVADDERDVVVRLDAEDGHQIGEPLPVPPPPVALAAGAGRIWVAGATGTLVAIDTGSGSVGTVIDVGGAPADVVVVDGTVWVADLEGSGVVPVDAASGAVGEFVEVPAGAVRLVASEERLWVSNLDSTVTAVDLATREVGEPVPVGAGPIGLAVAGGVVWVANGDDGTVSRIDEATGEPVGEPIAVGPAPVALEVVGDDVWVVEQDGRSASRLDLRTGEVELRSGDLATRPRGIASGGDGTVWVAGVDPSAAVRLLGPG